MVKSLFFFQTEDDIRDRNVTGVQTLFRSTLDPGKEPEACARRELLEETGVTAARLERLTSIWTTPGFTTEVIHLYLATGLRSEERRVGDDGLCDGIIRHKS